MKLVEILAKELGEWPDRYNTSAISQDSNKSLNRLDRGLLASQADMSVTDHGTWNARTWTMFSDLQVEQLATDHATAIVTREMWQAERDKQASIQVGIDAANSGCLKPLAEVKARYEHDSEDDSFSCEEYDPQPVSAETIGAAIFAYSNPVKWRDRILEIDATIEAMTAERAELVSKLAGEGFALIAVAAEPVEDMSDWRNWKAGDFIQIESEKSGHCFDIGEIVRIESVGDDESDEDCRFKCRDLKGKAFWFVGESESKFHSRPAS